jgi:hypothetical protein
MHRYTLNTHFAWEVQGKYITYFGFADTKRGHEVFDLPTGMGDHHDLVEL